MTSSPASATACWPEPGSYQNFPNLWNKGWKSQAKVTPVLKVRRSNSTNPSTAIISHVHTVCMFNIVLRMWWAKHSHNPHSQSLSSGRSRAWRLLAMSWRKSTSIAIWSSWMWMGWRMVVKDLTSTVSNSFSTHIFVRVINFQLRCINSTELKNNSQYLSCF